jgi:hypothetical protein
VRASTARATLGALCVASFVGVACAATRLRTGRAPDPSIAAPRETTAAGASAQSPDENRAAWDRLATYDGAACRERLRALEVSFRPLPDGEAPNAQGCGIPHGVLVDRGPTGVKYVPPLQIDCSLATELPAIERAIQQQAERELGEPIAKITTFGTYSCRGKRGGVNGNLSEHAVGNAIDFGGFATRRGRPINVKRDYRPFEDPPHAQSRFLQGVFEALHGQGGLTHVIGPETRADHQDHIHVDRGASWWR